MEKVSNNQEDEISIREIIDKLKYFFNYLRANKKTLIIITFFSVLMGIGYYFVKKSIYTATTTFTLEEDKAGGGVGNGALGLASQFGLDLGSGSGSTFSSSNILELMKSRRIVTEALLSSISVNDQPTTLANHYIQIYNLQNKKKLVVDFPPTKNVHTPLTYLQDSVMYELYKKILKQNLTAYQKDKKISIYSITVVSKNELFSKYFCEALVKQTSLFYIETKTKKAKQSVEILERQTDSIRQTLNNAISGVAIATDNVFNLNPAFNVKRTPSSKKQVDVQANTAMLTQLVGNLELARINLRKETPLVQIIDAPILPLEVQKPSLIYALLVSFFLGIIFGSIFLLCKMSYLKYFN